MTTNNYNIIPGEQRELFPNLDLDDNFILPEYHGRSILNIPSSICSLLGIPGLGAESLNAKILDPLGSDVQHVVLILMDALAWQRLMRWMEDGTAALWSQFANDSMLAQLTSICPSTTSSALTSYWTGRSAAEHGITGYEMWLKEYGLVANSILHAPMSFKRDVGSLRKAGFVPEEFLSLPTLGTHLKTHGVTVNAFQHRSIAYSGLSRMLLKDVKVNAFHTAADLWVNVRELLQINHTQRTYSWIYWSEVDHFGHLYGPDNERTAEEFHNFSTSLERIFLKSLSPGIRKNTLLILTADHGQINTQFDPHFELRNHPQFMQLLHIQPTGENRLAFLHIRPRQVDTVKDYFEQTWPTKFILLDSSDAVRSGLFGPGDPNPQLVNRLGDLIVIARDDSYLWWADKKNHLLGRHGGLHPDEMLVPFWAVRLG